MIASDGDFDIAALSFATMLDTSARIAVVAARDVRRKDRRVCMNRSCSHRAQVSQRLKLRKFRAHRSAMFPLVVELMFNGT
jgi:hypothetical protein